jgi:single-strand DNA-binding protein
MVNRVILIGNLGQDPEIRSLENGAMVARIRLATTENYKDKSGEWQQLTEWHDVVAWRQQAEKAQNSLRKGAMVYVEGKLSTRSWQDKDGNPRKTTEVVADYLRALDSKKAPGSAMPSEKDDPYHRSPAAPAPVAMDAPPVQVSEGDNDDLPF